MKKIIGKPSEYLHLLLGNLLYAIGFNLFLNGNNIAAGGFGGIGLVVSRFLPVSVGTVVVVLSIPIFLWSYKVQGAKYTISAFLSTLAFSGFTDFLSFLPNVTENKLLAALCGGAIYGLAAFTLVRGRVSGSGSDLLGRLLITKFRVLSLGTFVMLVDIFVVLTSVIAFRDLEGGIYAGVTIVTISFVTDACINGGNRAYMFEVITNADPDELANRIFEKLDRSSTLLRGIGMYKHEERNMLMVVVSPRQVYDMKDIIKEVAPDAFVVLVSASEIMGEGFRGLDVTVPIKEIEAKEEESALKK